MAIVLGPHQYGKAETRLVRVQRDAARHEIRDLNVSTSLRGNLTEAHLYGDQSQVLATDTQKNTAFTYAQSKDIASIKEFGVEHDHTRKKSGREIRTAAVRCTLITQFATLQSLALQQSLWHRGKAVLAEHPQIIEIQFAAPNKHHFEVDLSPFGLENNSEVFHAADRPYGLTHATVTHDNAPDAGNAWVPGAGLA